MVVKAAEVVHYYDSRLFQRAVLIAFIGTVLEIDGKIITGLYENYNGAVACSIIACNSLH